MTYIEDLYEETARERSDSQKDAHVQAMKRTLAYISHPMPYPSLSTIAVSIAVLLSIGLTRPAWARDSEDDLSTHSAERAWLQNYDPTLLTPRLLSELNYQDLDSDRSLIRLETTLRWAHSIRDDLVFGMQVMVPLASWHDDETATGTEEPEGPELEGGFGDLQFRTGIVGRISPTLRWGLGLNTTFDTASDPQLGGGALVLRPMTALRWDAAKHLNLGIQVEYNFTPSDEGSDDVSALELKFPLAFKINDTWSAALTYKPRWNFLTDDDRHRIDLGATRVWGADHQYALSFSTEVPLTDESLEMKLISAFAWYF